eukprot:6199553-Pleurochrysis_carterae.AAC.1
MLAGQQPPHTTHQVPSDGQMLDPGSGTLKAVHLSIWVVLMESVGFGPVCEISENEVIKSLPALPVQLARYSYSSFATNSCQHASQAYLLIRESMGFVAARTPASLHRWRSVRFLRARCHSWRRRSAPLRSRRWLRRPR